MASCAILLAALLLLLGGGRSTHDFGWSAHVAAAPVDGITLGFPSLNVHVDGSFPSARNPTAHPMNTDVENAHADGVELAEVLFHHLDAESGLLLERAWKQFRQCSRRHGRRKQLATDDCLSQALSSSSHASSSSTFASSREQTSINDNNNNNNVQVDADFMALAEQLFYRRLHQPLYHRLSFSQLERFMVKFYFGQDDVKICDFYYHHHPSMSPLDRLFHSTIQLSFFVGALEEALFQQCCPSRSHMIVATRRDRSIYSLFPPVGKDLHQRATMIMRRLQRDLKSLPYAHVVRLQEDVHLRNALSCKLFRSLFRTLPFEVRVERMCRLMSAASKKVFGFACVRNNVCGSYVQFQSTYDDDDDDHTNDIHDDNNMITNDINDCNNDNDDIDDNNKDSYGESNDKNNDDLRKTMTQLMTNTLDKYNHELEHLLHGLDTTAQVPETCPRIFHRVDYTVQQLLHLQHELRWSFFKRISLQTCTAVLPILWILYALIGFMVNMLTEMPLNVFLLSFALPPVLATVLAVLIGRHGERQRVDEELVQRALPWPPALTGLDLVV